jgi:DNA/RNA endonuclease G (NUC1)
MRMKTATRWAMFAGALLSSSLAVAQVRISEIHYDNAGIDAGEAVEVSAPAGTDLSEWRIVLYNGSNGASYDDDLLSGTVEPSCGARGVAVLAYPSNGLQNGPPDGLALVDPAGQVVEFLSYEGTFAATNGPASGLTSTDILAFEDANVPVGQSLQRNPEGLWGLAPATFGQCNDFAGDGEVQIATITIDPAADSFVVGGSRVLVATAFDADGAPVAGATIAWSSSDLSVVSVDQNGLATGVSAGSAVITAMASNGVSGTALIDVIDTPPPSDVHFSELHYDNAGADAGEAIEIEGTPGTDLTGYSIVLYNGNGGVPYGTRVLEGALPASCEQFGVLAVTYPPDGIQNGPDGIALVDNFGRVLDFLSYEGTFVATSGPAAGMMSIDIEVAQSSAETGTSLQRAPSGAWLTGVASFGSCNPDEPPPPGNTLQFSGRTPTDVPLPVGFEDQLFARLVAPGNVTVESEFIWESLTPAVATIDARGVIRALAAGEATFQATAMADGTTATWTLPTRVAVASTSAQYGNNTEFGEPLDADPTDDYIIERPQFTSSWNPNRGAPNWVAYAIDATHFGGEDRCDCFTMDAELPATLPRLDTADYTGAGDFHGYGIDRGHLARSFDRTAGGLDNAVTYYFSNIIPQAADNNQGPWAQFENHLGDLARLQDREVYVIAGASGNQGTLKNEGKIVIPTHTWKVALIMPRDRGLDDVRDYRDVEVVAVILPNQAGIRNVPWQDYQRTVDEVEALSGYDLLALLEDDVEAAVESGTRPPIADIAGPAGTVLEGSSVSLSGAGSVDPNGTIESYTWDFGDGASATGIAATHTFAQDGSYTVRLTVTDDDGLRDVASFTVTVANAAPVVASLPDGTLDVGATYSVTGTFSDPGADSWTATVLWGDGSAPEVVALAGQSFRLTHIYTAAGRYAVTVRIADDDVTTETVHTVTVNESSPGLAAALPLIDQLVAGRKISRQVGVLLKAQVIAAKVMIGRGNVRGAAMVLRSVVFQLDLLVRCRHVRAADVAPLRTLLSQVASTLRVGAG